jgi:hypothetical protein
MTKPTLYLIRGLPGSGKSTLAASMLSSGIIYDYHEADHHFIIYSMLVGDFVYSFDKEKLGTAHHECKIRTVGQLLEGHSVAVSNTSTTEKEVKEYETIAKDCNASFVSIIVENRHGFKSVHDVPEKTIAKMKNRFSIKL